VPDERYAAPLGGFSPELMRTRADAERAIADSAENGSMRGKVVPMIARALAQYPPYGLDITGWDFVIIPTGTGLVAGVVLACKGIDLIGAGKELCQFVTLPTWDPTQQQIDEIVQILGNGLRDYREQQKGLLAR
jgi:hypothetical protein